MARRLHGTKKGLSILLADFFDYTLAQPRKNPVTDRIEAGLELMRSSIASTEAMLDMARGTERILCLELLARWYRSLNDVPNEIRVLNLLDQALPPESKERGTIDARLRELRMVTADT